MLSCLYYCKVLWLCCHNTSAVVVITMIITTSLLLLVLLSLLLILLLLMLVKRTKSEVCSAELQCSLWFWCCPGSDLLPKLLVYERVVCSFTAHAVSSPLVGEKNVPGPRGHYCSPCIPDHGSPC